MVVVVRTDFTMRAQLHEFLFTFLELLHHKHTTLFAYAIHVYAGAQIYDLLPRALYRQGKQKCRAPKCMKPTRPAAVACDAHADARPPPCAPSGLADTSARPGPGLATCIECCLLQSFDVILYAQKDFARVKIDSARLGWSGLMLIEKSGQHPCQLWACLYSVAEPIDISILETI